MTETHRNILHLIAGFLLFPVMMLLGEALILSSTAIAIWFAAVLAAIHLWVVFVEEPGLKKRFGEDYRLYRANVRRWLPRPSAWTPPREPREDDRPEDPQAKHWEGYRADTDKNPDQP